MGFCSRGAGNNCHHTVVKYLNVMVISVLQNMMFCHWRTITF